MGTSPSFILKFGGDALVPFPAATTERIFNRDAVAPSSPLTEVRWPTGEAYFEVEAAASDVCQIRMICIENFTCVIFLERVYEMMVELGVVFAGPDGYFIAREHFRPGCIPADLPDDSYTVVASCDEFIDRLEIIYVNCGPDAELRSKPRDRRLRDDAPKPVHDDALLKAFGRPC